MISEHSLLAAELLAKELADRGIAVVAKGGSFISNISGLSDITNVIQAINAECNEPMSVNTRLQLLFNNPVHTEAMARLVKNINYANSTLLNTGKNAVIPLVNFMADRYSEYIANVESNAVLPINVEVVEDDLFWTNNMFRESVNSLPTDFLKDVSLSITFPNKERDELEFMVKTGMARFDSQLTESINRYSESAGYDVYKDVWDTIFSRRGERRVNTLQGYYTGNKTKILYGLPVLWAFLKYLSNENNIPSGLVCSIAEYRGFITDALSHVNTIIFSQFDSMDRDDKNKKVIISFPNGMVDGKRKQVVRVKKSIYNTFLSEGGTIETILGSSISERDDLMDDLLQKKDVFESRWREHHSLINSTITSEIREIKRLGLKKALIEASQEYEKQQLANTNPDINPAEATIEYKHQYWADMPEDIQSFVDNLDEHKLSEINYISQQLICDLLFCNTDVYKILDLVNEYGKKNPNASAKEALTLAITDYVINWLFDQLDFVAK